MNIRIGILTVSDRCSQGLTEDISGQCILEKIRSGIFNINCSIDHYKCVPDTRRDISNVLYNWTDNEKLDLIITTGGTGFAERDVTPEATKVVIEKEVPGIATALITEGLKFTPMAMLSRLVCGIRKNTLIINFPGSPKACDQCLDIIKPIIKHAIDLLKNNEDVEKSHKMNELNQFISNVKVDEIACRNRKSPYSLVKPYDAQNAILDSVEPFGTVIKNTIDALNYVLSTTIHAQEPFPPFPASMKDGYAVRSADGIINRNVVCGLLPGSENPKSVTLGNGDCVRITTGAAVPDDADAVVQVEDTTLVETDETKMHEKIISIQKLPIPGQDIRKIGSDIEKDSIVVLSGTVLTSSELGLLATVGVNAVEVFRKPKIAILSTGNELQSLGDIPQKGKIFDSNKVTLMGLLKENGYEAIDCGIAIDEPSILLEKIHSSLYRADVLITSGGVSMGERDLIADVLIKDLKAKLVFGRINMKPGKPTKFFRVPFQNSSKFVFALPGNPVSAMVTCRLFVFPALKKMSGVKDNVLPTLFDVKISKDVKLDERYEFARAKLEWGSNDIPTAHLTGNQVSSRLMNMVTADCLLHLPPSYEENTGILCAGHRVKAQFI